MQERQSRARVLLAGLALVGSVLIGPVLRPAPAAADPGYPSSADVQAAPNVSESTAARVGRLQSRLAASAARVVLADAAAGEGAEDYDQARILLQQRDQTAASARAAASAAADRLARAHQQIGRLQQRLDVCEVRVLDAAFNGIEHHQAAARATRRNFLQALRRG